LILRGAQWIEYDTQPWEDEKGMQSDIKVDKATIIKRRIYLYGIFKWPSRPTIEETKGDFDCVSNFAAWKFPTGPAGSYSGPENTNSR
jgi:hypothetical protein